MSSNPASTNLSQSVFVSYRREDSSGHTGRLFDRISNHFGDRIKVFMDIDAIAPGEDFISVIESAVGVCEILIAVIGADWLTVTDKSGKRRLDNPEDFIRVEIATALNRNIRVIPVLVQGASMPRREDLPDALAGLSRRNAIEISDARWKYDVDRLIATIENVLSQQSAKIENSQQQTPQDSNKSWSWQKAGAVQQTPHDSGRSRTWSWQKMGAVAGLVILLLVGIWLVIPLFRNETASNNPDNSSPSNSNRSNTAVNESTTPANVTTGSQDQPAKPTESPLTPGPETNKVIQVVGVVGKTGRRLSQGFFTPKGYIVAMVGNNTSDELEVTWDENGQNHKEIAQVIRIENMTALLKLKNRGLLPHHAPIRLSNSLQSGEAVHRFITAGDSTPGKVLEVNAAGMLPGIPILKTTNISTIGDGGAPVIDSQGRIVSMILGASVKETQSLPIEKIKLMFPEAFN